MSAPEFLLGIFIRGGKCRVVPAVGGHGRCAGRSLEEGVGSSPRNFWTFRSSEIAFHAI